MMVRWLILAVVLLVSCSQQIEPVQTQPEDIVDDEDVPPAASCDDGILNQGEEDVDCGGPCDACPSCDDGILNQGEEDVDCGGPCEPCEIEYGLTTEQEESLDEKLKPNMKADFLANAYALGLEPGESHVFALGITNTFQDTERFQVELSFKEARDKSNNLITQAQASTMMGWVSENEFETYELEKYEQAFLPVGVTVGEEIAPGVETIPGIYYFDAVVLYDDNNGPFDKYSELEFSVRVK